MTEPDAELLREFTRRGPQAQQAFAALVERHLPLVYSVARRHLRSADLAEDVAQSVFIDLARHAATLKPDAPLVAWLHLVSRRSALDAVRRETRRRAREQAAALLDEMKPPAWTDLAPLIDEAVESLPAPDRAAILLRFFEDKSLREVGAALGGSENAAQKRISRALDHLRVFFARRGIAVTAAALAADLSAHAIELPPAPLGASVAATAASAASASFIGGVTATFVMTALEKTLLAAAAVVALGIALVETQSLRAQRAELSAIRQQNAELAARLRDARSKVATQPPAEIARPPAPASLDPGDAPLIAEISDWLERAAKLRQLISARPDLAIPELQLLTEEQVLAAARTVQFGNESQIRDAFAVLRSTAEQEFMSRLRGALQRYLATHENRLPETVASLAPFFEAPVDPATFRRYEMIAQGKLGDLPPGQDMLVRLATPVDRERDSLRETGLSAWKANSYPSAVRKFRAGGSP